MARTSIVTITCDNCGAVHQDAIEMSAELPSLSTYLTSDVVGITYTGGRQRDYCALCVQAVNTAIEASLAMRKRMAVQS